MRTAARALAIAFLILVLTAGPALACGGLVNPNGTVSLLKTTTMVGYVDGVEHYVTSFEFAGGGAEFGSIVPLPGIPSDVERAGDWTLQRLVQEVAPPVRDAVFANSAVSDAAGAEVIMETQIEALDITILKGGGDEVGQWAKDNGFSLTPDAPEVLDFYAQRSPVFMAARFDPAEAAERNQNVGDGTPVHLTIPTPDPWVPLRILGLGLGDDARVEADVFLLTEAVPQMLPEPAGAGSENGLILERDERVNELLLSDLRSDKGMEWIPASDMWFSYIRIDTTAGELKHDLAIDATGRSEPSPVAAGLEPPLTLPEVPRDVSPVPWVIAILGGLGAFIVITRSLERT
ncbi:MAG: DUF2330 domain-containing protein [Actinomycetota bacterium]